jgi:hypothetical protein
MKHEPLIYDERTGMVAVYFGPKRNCLEMPSDSFLFVRWWETDPDTSNGTKYIRDEEACKIARVIASMYEMLDALKEIWGGGEPSCASAKIAAKIVEKVDPEWAVNGGDQKSSI